MSSRSLRSGSSSAVFTDGSDHQDDVDHLEDAAPEENDRQSRKTDRTFTVTGQGKPAKKRREQYRRERKGLLRPVSCEYCRRTHRACDRQFTCLADVQSGQECTHCARNDIECVPAYTPRNRWRFISDTAAEKRRSRRQGTSAQFSEQSSRQSSRLKARRRITKNTDLVEQIEDDSSVDEDLEISGSDVVQNTAEEVDPKEVDSSESPQLLVPNTPESLCPKEASTAFGASMPLPPALMLPPSVCTSGPSITTHVLTERPTPAIPQTPQDFDRVLQHFCSVGSILAQQYSEALLCPDPPQHPHCSGVGFFWSTVPTASAAAPSVALFGHVPPSVFAFINRPAVHTRTIDVPETD